MRKIWFSIFLLLSLAFVICEEPKFIGFIDGKVKLASSSKTWGKLSWLIENGSKVKKNQVVAKLDPERTQEYIDSIKDGLETMENELLELKKELKESSDESDVMIRQETLERDLVRVNYQIAAQGIVGIEKVRFETDIRNAKIEVEKMEIEFESTRKLYEQGLEQKQVYEQKEVNLKIASNNVALEENKFEGAKYLRELDAKTKKKELDIKEVQLKVALKQKEHKLQKIKYDIKKKEENIINQKDSLKYRQAELVNHEILAGVDGVARYKKNHGKIIEVGDRIGKGFAVVDILSTEQKKVLIDVEEKYILNYKIGDEMDILIEDTNEKIVGEITSISSTPQDKNEKLGPVGRQLGGLSGITVFEVEVTFDDKDQRFTSGLKVHVWKKR